MSDRPESRAALELVDHIETSPVLIHVPHSSRTIPTWARPGLTLDDEALSLNLDTMTDAHTDLIARLANQTCSTPASLFINQLSRLVVDPERFPDEREEMLKVGMGAVYTRGPLGDPIRDETDEDLRRGLITTVFDPYSRQLAETVQRVLDRHGRAVIIDLHSFPVVASPYELHADSPRPQVCLGADPSHTSPQLLRAAQEAFSEYETAVNTPFSGTYVPLMHYQREPRVESIMIEIRRDQYLDDNLGPDKGGTSRVSQALGELLERAADGTAGS